MDAALAVLGITVPVVFTIAGVAWRLAVRLERIEEALHGPSPAVLKLAERQGLVWVLDNQGQGHWYPRFGDKDLT